MRNARRLAAFGSTAAILVALTLVVLAATLVAPRTAEAHADIEVARPGAGEVLARSPQRIEITFTEAVALDQSHVHVLDTTGARVDLDDLRLVEGDLRTLRVGVPELPEGAYTVDWGNLSTVDGHTLTGSYVFFIGADAFTPPDASADDGGEPLPIAEPLTRWGVLLGLVLLAGVPAVFGLVLARTASPEDATTLRRDIERIALVGGAVVLVVGGAQLAFKLNEADAGLSLLTDTRWGSGWALRTALAALATAAYAFGPRNLPRRARPAVPVLAVAAALSVSLTSHGAASEDVALVAGLVDALHVLATVAWGGGLVAFLVLARRQRTDRRQSEVLRAAIPRFAVLGGLATLTLAVTGTYAAWLHVGSLDAVASNYGRGVVVKTTLLVVLVGIAAVNTIWVRRRVAHPRDVDRGRTWLRRLLTAEVALIAVVLAASAMVTSIEPARQQRAAEERAAGVVTETEDTGLTVRSAISPGEIGPNVLTVELLRDGERYEDATAVELRYVNVEAALSAATGSLDRRADGSWVLSRPAILSVNGIYRFDIRVQWPAGVDARQTVQFETGVERATSEVNPATAWWAGLLALEVVAIAMIAANTIASRRRVMRSELLGWSGAALAALALLLWSRSPEPPVTADNPIPASADSLARGGDLYATNCARCHGAEFDGTGPDASTLPVSPADLVLHFPQHSDGQHFAVISNGRPASGMPAWEGVLTEDDIWNVINYLRAETEARAPTLQAP